MVTSGDVFISTGDEDWQTDLVELKAHTWHYHNFRGVLVRVEQKGTGQLEDMLVQATPREATELSNHGP